jgi:hypothetical protein
MQGCLEIMQLVVELKAMQVTSSTNTSAVLTVQQLVESLDIQGPFAKFVDSPYYSELELCGGVVMVSFSKYLP